MPDQSTTPRIDASLEREMLALMPRLRRYAMVLTGRRADADDLLQATYERAIERIGSWVPGTRLDAWMFTIARNLFLNERRSSVYRQAQLAGLRLAVAQHHNGEAVIEGRSQLDRVCAGLDRLPEEQRSALILCSIEGLSYDEIATVLGVAPGTVASRIARARATLKAGLEAAVPDRSASAPPARLRSIL